MPKFVEIGPPVQEKKILKYFYHIWAWRPSWSCDLNFLYTHWFPFPIDASIKFVFDWPIGFREEDLLKWWTTTDGRTTDAGAWVYYKLTCEPSAQVS